MTYYQPQYPPTGPAPQSGWGQPPYGPYQPQPYGAPPRKPKGSLVPLAVCGGILAVMLAGVLALGVWAWHSWTNVSASVSAARQDTCSAVDARPTVGLDEEKAVKEARKYAAGTTFSRAEACYQLTGQFDEPTATWALGQIEAEADWDGNAVRALGQSLRWTQGEDDRTYRDMLLVSGFTEDQADYALAHKADAQAIADQASKQ